MSWLPGRTLDCNTTIPTSEPSAPPKPLAVGLLSAANTLGPSARHSPRRIARRASDQLYGNVMKRPGDRDPRRPPGDRRPPDYVIVVSASDWVKEHFPAAGADFWHVMHTGKDRHRDPEPDLEAEP